MKIKIEIDSEKLNKQKLKFFFKDLVNTYLWAFKKALSFILQHWIKSLIILIFFIILAILVSFTVAFFWSFFLALLIMNLDSRASIVLALICLLSCPFLLFFRYQSWAEEVAIWAYYFLVIGVTLQIIETYRSRESTIQETKPGFIIEPLYSEENKIISLHHHKKEARKQSKKNFILIFIAIFIGLIIVTLGGIFFLRGYFLVEPPINKETIIPYDPKSQSEEKKLTFNKESVTITILNGNGVPGAANRLKNELEEGGFKVKYISDAERHDYPETIIRYQPGGEDKAEVVSDFLKKKYRIQKEETNISQETEIVIIVGQK